MQKYSREKPAIAIDSLACPSYNNSGSHIKKVVKSTIVRQNMLRRKITEDLLKWKSGHGRKALIV
ncbi:MAG: hypothetical protein LBU13_04750, partial [Synergistaceae bacterium]|nr:hypothetical protein [Synergistaceae bacterium]